MLKKRGMDISNNISYIILVLIFVIILGVGVYAMTAGTAPNPGHTMDIVSAPSGCASNSFLKWTGSDWTCVPFPPTCSGTNQVLHWDGSSWDCYTVSISGGGSTGYECYWSGWGPNSYNSCYYDRSGCGQIVSDTSGNSPKYVNLVAQLNCADACYSPYAGQEVFITQEYCSYGTITQTRPVLVCPMPSSGECPPAYQVY
jgi:hypothetical protein